MIRNLPPATGCPAAGVEVVLVWAGAVEVLVVVGAADEVLVVAG